MQPPGHNYLTSTVPPTCTESGKTVYSCQVCGYERSDSDGVYPTGHDCNTVRICGGFYLPQQGCGALAGVAIAVAHKNEEKEKAKKMLVNYVIGLVVIAVIVVVCPYLIRGIAALVT